MDAHLVGLPVRIPVKEVYRYMGCPLEQSDISPALQEMVEEEMAAAYPLLSPKASCATYDYDAQTHYAATPGKGLEITGLSIRRHLHGCEKVTIFTCTVGAEIELKIDTYFGAGEYTRALIMDAIGSAAVEEVADTINKYVQHAAHKQAYHLVSRFSPGYGDWDLAIQKELVAAAGGHTIGIQVTPSSLLLPRKSVSALIGWIPGAGDPVRTASSPCNTCTLPRCDNPICKGGNIS